MNEEIGETGQLPVKLLELEEWGDKVAAVKQSGESAARELLDQGLERDVQILAPREMPAADPEATIEENSVPLAAAILNIDWKIETRRHMAELVRDLLTQAYLIESFDASLPTVLAAAIEGRGLFEHGIGEFFLLYGRFEQKNRTSGKKTGKKMKALVNGDPRYLKRYTERGKATMQPLPYAVRNILSHVGTNPNTLNAKENDLGKSIQLLRSWVRP